MNAETKAQIENTLILRNFDKKIQHKEMPYT